MYEDLENESKPSRVSRVLKQLSRRDRTADQLANLFEALDAEKGLLGVRPSTKRRATKIGLGGPGLQS